VKIKVKMADSAPTLENLPKVDAVPNHL